MARWSVDGVWYRVSILQQRLDATWLVMFSKHGNSAVVGRGRAEVTEVLEGNDQFVVFFIDYGNSAKVQRANMVAGRAAVPAGQAVDPHV